MKSILVLVVISIFISMTLVAQDSANPDKTALNENAADQIKSATTLNNIITGDTLVCDGSVPSCLTGSVPTGGLPPYQYHWEQKTAAGSWTAMTPPETGQDLCFTAPLDENTLFRRVVTDANVIAEVSNEIRISILPVGQVNQPADQVVCNGGMSQSVTFSTSISNGGVYYSWINDNTGIGLAGSGTGNIPAFMAVNFGTNPMVATIVVTPHFFYWNKFCSGPPKVFTITVYPSLTSGMASNDQYICFGIMPMQLSCTSPYGGSSSFSYQWQSAISSGGPWNNVIGANSLSYQPPVLYQTTWYRVVQTDSYCNPDQTVITNVVKITVIDQLSPGTACCNQVICSGENPALIITTAPTGGSGIFYYQWQTTSSVGAPWQNIPGAIGLNFLPPVLFQTTMFRLVQTDPYCNPDMSVYTNTVTIEVFENIHQLVTGEISGTNDVCSGSMNVPYSVLPVEGATNYSWILPLGATIATGAGTHLITVNFTNFTGSGVIKVTPSNGCSSAIPSPSFPVRINPPLSGNYTLSNITIQPGQTGCLAADSIFTGGISGSFTIPNTARVKLVAEKAITLLNGTIVSQGGYLSAVITNFCIPCGNNKSLITNPDDQEDQLADVDITSHSDNGFFKVYPNPAHDRITVELMTETINGGVEMTLYDIYGRLAESSLGFDHRKYSFSVENLSPGVYVMLVRHRGLEGKVKIVRIP